MTPCSLCFCHPGAPPISGVRTEGSGGGKTPTHPASPLTPSPGPPGYCPLCTLFPPGLSRLDPRHPRGEDSARGLPAQGLAPGQVDICWAQELSSAQLTDVQTDELWSLKVHRAFLPRCLANRRLCENMDKGGSEPREFPGRAMWAGPGDRTLLVQGGQLEGGGEGRGQGQRRGGVPSGAWRESKLPRGTSVSLLGREGVCLHWF